jgi:protein phosphatase methylesterase 1
MKIPKS